MKNLMHMPKLDSQTLFSALLGYYIAVLFFLPPPGYIPRFSPAYFALVLPVLFYTAANFRHLLSGYSTASMWLLTFGILVSVVSLFRLDFDTLRRVLVFTLPILAILNSRPRLDLRVVNSLFLGAFIIHLLINHGEITIPPLNRGSLPGLASDIRDLTWRLSLLPFVPESAFFSVLVVIINLFLSARRWRYLFIGLGTAFVLLSGIRSATVALILVFLLFVLSRYRWFNWAGLYALYFTVVITLFVITLTTDVLFYIAPRFDSELINSFLYRHSEGLQSVGHLRETIYRGVVWERHLSLFLEHPLFGVGTFTVLDLLRDSSSNAETFCSSCSFLTEWTARVGLMIVPLLIFIGLLIARAVFDRDPYLLGICLTLTIVSLTWGTLLVPYNPIFLLLFGAIGTSQRLRQADEQASPCQ